MNEKPDSFYFYGWVVVRVGRKRRTPQTVSIYDRHYEKWDKVKCYTIFPSKKAAYAWRDRWVNKDDFDLFRVVIPTA